MKCTGNLELLLRSSWLPTNQCYSKLDNLKEREVLWSYNHVTFFFSSSFSYSSSLIAYHFCAEAWYLSSFLLFRQGRWGSFSCLICQRVVVDPPITTYSFANGIFSSVIYTFYQVSLPLRNLSSGPISCFLKRPLFETNCIFEALSSRNMCNAYGYLIIRLIINDSQYTSSETLSKLLLSYCSPLDIRSINGIR